MFTEQVYRRTVKNRSVEHRIYSNRIGRLCTAWGHLELDVTMLLDALTALKDPVPKNTILSLMDFREKLQAVKVIGYDKKPNKIWYEKLASTVNKIENELRPERNRMIHDFWLLMPKRENPDQREMQRANFRPKIEKPKPFQTKISLASYEVIKPDDISKLTKDIEDASVSFLVLAGQVKPEKLRATIKAPTPKQE